jgi:hypothetical protein
MSAQVEVVIKELPGVLLVPIQAVVAREGGRYCVLVNNGESEAIPVKTGDYNDTFIEIREGLDEGDVVLVKPSGRDWDAIEYNQNGRRLGPQQRYRQGPQQGESSDPRQRANMGEASGESAGERQMPEGSERTRRPGMDQNPGSSGEKRPGSPKVPDRAKNQPPTSRDGDNPR